MKRCAKIRLGQADALLPGFEGAVPPGYAHAPVLQEQLPTNTTTRRHRVHRWFNFIAGFSPELVHQCCADANLRDGDILLDPFAGCGTALLVACERGLRAVGYDPHPVFSRIARAKLPTTSDVSDLRVIHDELRRGLKCPVDPHALGNSPAKFLTKLFEPDVLAALAGARQALIESGFDRSDLAFLVLSRMLERCSHSQTDGIYKAPTTRKNTVDPLTACDETIQVIKEDLVTLNGADFECLTEVHMASSEKMAEINSEQISIAVTSPPYLNNFDFAEMTRMHLYFWGIATSWGEITDRVRSRLIVNTTTALSGQKSTQWGHRANVPPCMHASLDGLVQVLRKRKNTKAGKKEYDLLVYPYFSQITNVLRECFRCLKAGAPLHIMVADAALYGVHISTPQLLRDIIAEIGFRDARCELIRRRGHRWILAKRQGSNTGLGEYHVHATK